MNENSISPFRIIKKNLVTDLNVWSVLIFSVSICVFVQCLFTGFTAGIDNGYLMHTSVLPEAFEGWNLLISALVTILIGVIVATTVVTLVSEKRKNLSVLFSIGVHRKDMLKSNIIESLFAGIGSYLVGLVPALIIGYLMNMNHPKSGNLSVTSIPFSLSVFMLIPLFVILGSIIISNMIMIFGIFRAPLVEVMNYE